MAKSLISHSDTKKEMGTDPNNQMNQLNIDNRKNINILLFGETGVGKSTFINAFYNYLKYPDLKSAMENEPEVLIPTKFTITDENYKLQVIEIGTDANTPIQNGASMTQFTEHYDFPIKRGNANIRLIDTPGIADTRGIDIDNSNFENILDFIGELEHLNGICILLKPDNSRLTAQFEYIIKQIFLNLHRSVCDNLIFVFTNTRSTFYRPGETLATLEELFKSIESVEIPLEKKNIYCVDNEAFRFWTAYYSGIHFSRKDIENFSTSWEISFSECWKMINYIVGTGENIPLKPHLVQNTICVNEARRLILKLSKPLADIAQNTENNIFQLQRYKKEFQSSDRQLTQLFKKLSITITDLAIIPLEHPATVCTSVKCSKVYEVNDVQKWHYKQVCHSPCSLEGVPKKIVGSPLLAGCYAMRGKSSCQECGCEYDKHMHIDYETKTVLVVLENEDVKSEINNQKSVQKNAKTMISEIEEVLKDFNEEKDVILKTTAKFAHFLQTNAITPYNDAYEGYLFYLINREKSVGARVDYNAIRVLESMLDCYNEEKRILSEALSMNSDGANEITAKEVIESVDKLYKLKHNGENIKKLFQARKPLVSSREAKTKKEGIGMIKACKNFVKTVWKGRPDASNISSNAGDNPKGNKEQSLPNTSEILSKPITKDDLQENKAVYCVSNVADISPESIVNDGSEKNKGQILGVSSDTSPAPELDVKDLQEKKLQF